MRNGVSNKRKTSAKAKPKPRSKEAPSGQSLESQMQNEGSSSQLESQPLEFINHVRFLQDMVLYCTLRYATQHGDIGLLRRVIPRLCVYFHGGPSKNYAREMLYLWRLISTDACPPVMQRAILRNGLINKRGKSDSWMPIDFMLNS